MSGHEHDHDEGHEHDANHEHPHRPSAPDEPPPGTYATLEIAVRELLIEKGLLTADELRRRIEILDSRSPALGARVVAHAWVDPAFKRRLLENGSAACEELGVTMYDNTRLIVMENTEKVHNLVVCTLCSCYPRPVLGLPPDWYKNRQYRTRAVREPRAVLAEFGTEIAETVEIRVHDSNANMRYLILPPRPPGTEELSEAELADLVTRDAMIGVTGEAPRGRGPRLGADRQAQLLRALDRRGRERPVAEADLDARRDRAEDPGDRRTASARSRELVRVLAGRNPILHDLVLTALAPSC